MKYLVPLLLMLFPLLANAQFQPSGDGSLTIIVTDGTFKSKDSPQRPPGDVDLRDPIRPLGMMDAIQAGAFIERPDFGRAGFILIFCVNDSIGGKQGTITINGNTYTGVYRLIRQKMSLNEEVPKGMTNYRLEGTVYFLGIS
jgi:hypothetical protein